MSWADPPDGAGLVEGADEVPVVAYRRRAESIEALGRCCRWNELLVTLDDADTEPFGAESGYKPSLG